MGPGAQYAFVPQAETAMSWLGILIVVVAGYLAMKVVGGLFKLLLGVLVLVGLYMVLAPMLGWPFPLA